MQGMVSFLCGSQRTMGMAIYEIRPFQGKVLNSSGSTHVYQSELDTYMEMRLGYEKDLTCDSNKRHTDTDTL